MSFTTSRRELLRLAGAVAVGVGTAGCVSVPQSQTESRNDRRRGNRAQGPGSGPHGPMSPGDGEHMGPRGGPGSHRSPMGPHHGPGPRRTGTAGADAAGSLDQWFGNVDNYAGVADHTGRNAVTVAVGASGNGGGFAYDPPAIRVTEGTTVTWEWTGDGGSHDVVAVDESFASALRSDAGVTFAHTFDEAGTYRYYCTPHRTLGMKGAVLVVE